MSPFVISALNTIFQTVVTTIVIFILFFTLARDVESWEALLGVLVFEWIVMTFHLAYRVRHRGDDDDARANNSLKVSHTILSAIALVWGTWFAWRGLHGALGESVTLLQTAEIVILIWIWLLALGSGAFVFILKYER